MFGPWSTLLRWFQNHESLVHVRSIRVGRNTLTPAHTTSRRWAAHAQHLKTPRVPPSHVISRICTRKPITMQPCFRRQRCSHARPGTSRRFHPPLNGGCPHLRATRCSCPSHTRPIPHTVAPATIIRPIVFAEPASSPHRLRTARQHAHTAARRVPSRTSASRSASSPCC